MDNETALAIKVLKQELREIEKDSATLSKQWDATLAIITRLERRAERPGPSDGKSSSAQLAERAGVQHRAEHFAIVECIRTQPLRHKTLHMLVGTVAEQTGIPWHRVRAACEHEDLESLIRGIVLDAQDLGKLALSYVKPPSGEMNPLADDATPR